MQGKKILFSKSINYGIRGLIVLLGILLLSGVIDLGSSDPALRRVFGAVCILYGVYRMAIYRLKIKTYNFNNDEEEESDNEKKNA